MVMAGRETRGWLRVSVDGVKTKRQLQSWVTRGVDYAKGCRRNDDPVTAPNQRVSVPNGTVPSASAQSRTVSAQNSVPQCALGDDR